MVYTILAGLICSITLLLVFEFVDEIVENEVIAGHIKAFILLVLFALVTACLGGA